MGVHDLYWLPREPDWPRTLAAIPRGSAAAAWPALAALARCSIDALETRHLDRILKQLFPAPPVGLATRPVRLAVLASATVEHLLPAIRVAGLRRGIWIATHTPAYGQYRQELIDRGSGLHEFQ